VSKNIKVGKGGQRRVYIDLGANWANTLRLYRDIGHDKGVGPWEVYAFEASPFMHLYVENFTAWLNGLGPKPNLTVTPSGSTGHLMEYSERYGCPRTDEESVRQCMFRVFKEPLQALKPNLELSNWDLINLRLAQASHSLKPNDRDRFTFVPAAAGANNGSLSLTLMTPEQMIRGGAVDDVDMVAGGNEMEVPLVDFATWLTTNFREEDSVVVKMDIEGGEFPILEKLISSKQLCLIDTLAWECHAQAGDCGAFRKKLDDFSCMERMEEGSGYNGWDSESTPDKYYPIDPRKANL
jgi:FkbM family methyltransferase